MHARILAGFISKCVLCWEGGILCSIQFRSNVAIESAFDQVNDKFKGETKGRTNRHLKCNYEGY